MRNDDSCYFYIDANGDYSSLHSDFKIWRAHKMTYIALIQMYIDAYIILPYLIWKKNRQTKIQNRIDFYRSECTPNYKIEKRLLELSSKL